MKGADIAPFQAVPILPYFKSVHTVPYLEVPYRPECPNFAPLPVRMCLPPLSVQICSISKVVQKCQFLFVFTLKNIIYFVTDCYRHYLNENKEKWSKAGQDGNTLVNKVIRSGVWKTSIKNLIQNLRKPASLEKIENMYQRQLEEAAERAAEAEAEN